MKQEDKYEIQRELHSIMFIKGLTQRQKDVITLAIEEFDKSHSQESLSCNEISNVSTSEEEMVSNNRETSSGVVFTPLTKEAYRTLNELNNELVYNTEIRKRERNDLILRRYILDDKVLSALNGLKQDTDDLYLTLKHKTNSQIWGMKTDELIEYCEEYFKDKINKWFEVLRK